MVTECGSADFEKVPMDNQSDSIHKKIYLVRHGQTDVNLAKILQGGRVDAPINKTGRQQSEAFYKKYSETPFEKIYTSLLIRSIKSVHPFISKGVPHEALPELNEIDYGIYDGKISSDEPGGIYSQLVGKWNDGYTDLKPEGGESPKEVQGRMKKFIALIRSRKEENILVSMHGRALRILLATMLHYDLKYMGLFTHENFGLYIVHDSGSFFTIEKFNDVSHLHEYPEPQSL